ncbi:MAG: PDZ domain-containing protein [Candidatus Omnitrophota bacterium]
MIVKKISLFLIILISVMIFVYTGRVFLDRRPGSGASSRASNSAGYVSDEEISALMRNRLSKHDSKDIDKKQVDYPDLRLEATMTTGVPRAYIRELDSQRAALYSIGDNVSIATLIDIKRDEVLLDVEGNIYSLYLESADFEEPIEDSPSSLKIVRRKDILGVVNSNNDGLGTLATLTPHRDNEGNFNGYLINGVKTASPASLAGIRNGDILTEVNNQQLLTPQKAIQVFKKVRKLNDINIGLLRDSKNITKKYRIK